MASTQGQQIRVLLVDDHALVRQGLRVLLSREHDVTIVGEADDGAEALAMTRDIRPDVVLMDVHMPGMTGAQATAQIVSSFPSVRVLALSISPASEDVSAMLDAGARGYLLKQATASEVMQAIRTVFRGESTLHPSVTRCVLNRIQQCAARVHPDDELTGREREVLSLVACGKTSRQISSELHLSSKTVNNYRAHILKKLGARNKVQAIANGIRLGLVQVDLQGWGEPVA